LRHGKLSPEHADHARELLRDIESLLPHNSFVFDKVNFLLDAAQGFINIEQNQIIKIFSIAAVVFLPPTLVASIYGMNYDFMPELKWRFAYPWALMLMVLSGVPPYWYFKRKGWVWVWLLAGGCSPSQPCFVPLERKYRDLYPAGGPVYNRRLGRQLLRRLQARPYRQQRFQLHPDRRYCVGIL